MQFRVYAVEVGFEITRVRRTRFTGLGLGLRVCSQQLKIVLVFVFIHMGIIGFKVFTAWGFALYCLGCKQFKVSAVGVLRLGV